jgi:hypothetical protein
MKIYVLDFDQAPGEVPRHEISRGKANRLLNEFRWAAPLNRDTIRVIVEKTWSAIKAALRPILPKASRPPSSLYIPKALPFAEIPRTAMKVGLTEVGRDLLRFRARNLKNRRTGKLVGIIYTQRLRAAELALAL